MKKIFLAFGFISVFASSSIAQKKRVNISLEFYQPYCGGARPTKEMEAESFKPKPLVNRMLILVSEKEKIDSLRTDAKGIIRCKLKPGNYKLYETWRYYRVTPNSLPLIRFDKNCLEIEWKREVKSIAVTRNSVKIEHKNNIIIPCDWKIPCITEKESLQIPD